MPADALFTPILVPDGLLEATGDHAFVRAMLDAEAALARAEAAVGLVPAEAAEAIIVACRDVDVDPVELGRAARESGNPVIPLVTALRAATAAPGRDHIHHGATSQDILDTAAMLFVAQRATAVTMTELDGLAGECATLAERHRHTVMAGRTLLQQAVPTTFGLKAAGWLVAVDARRRLAASRRQLAVQLGGAAGTLAALGTRGPEVVAGFAADLGLAEPVVPWHTARQRVADLAASLGIVAGTAAKIGGDVVLLAQPEVGEVGEARLPGRGGSSSMPHKHNPVSSIAALAAARRCAALVPVVLGALVAEHERAAGGWQAEWETSIDLLALSGGAVAHARTALHGLDVDAEAMARNLRASGGAALAERLVVELAPVLGREEAATRVEQAARAATADRSFADAVRADPVLADAVGDGRLDGLLDPGTYLGAADIWIDRALATYREEG